MTTNLTSLQRVLITLQHREPDRVPLFLLLTMHGAKELGLTLTEYFSRSEHVVEGQLRLRRKYGHDCYCPFSHAAAEIEAWGGEVVAHDDGPTTAGEPLIPDLARVVSLRPPPVAGNVVLERTLQAIGELKRRTRDVPILGVVMSPASLAVMQLGFEAYLTHFHERPDLLQRLTSINEDFCISWANAQLHAGATAICYFDPLSSPIIHNADAFNLCGYQAMRHVVRQIDGPTAVHFASGRCAEILAHVAATGASIVGVGWKEDLGLIKELAAGRLTILGNLNGVAMRRWSTEEAVREVTNALRAAAPGGGFLLSDSHGEIPLQVPDEILHTIAETAREAGRYPIRPTDD
jgi:uroporphyrinogen decarboxylase